MHTNLWVESFFGKARDSYPERQLLGWKIRSKYALEFTFLNALVALAWDPIYYLVEMCALPDDLCSSCVPFWDSGRQRKPS